MRLKHLFAKFDRALNTLYGIGRFAKSAVARLDETVVARPGTFDAAVAAQITRDLNRGQLERRRLNTRGLPKGYSVHQARRARRLQRSKKHRERATVTELHAAQTFIDDLKRTTALRRQAARPTVITSGRLAGCARRSFLQRVMPRAHKLTLKQLCAKVRQKLEAARGTGRIAYRQPQAA